MFRSLHLRLTLLSSISVFIIVILIGGCTYALLGYYFQMNTDLALQYRMAKEFASQSLPLPFELATAERNWIRNQDRLLPDLFIPPGWRNANPTAATRKNSLPEELYDGELAAIFTFRLDAGGALLPNSISNSYGLAPDINAVQAALTNDLDLRTVRLADDTQVRLLTYYIPSGDPIVFIQAGRSLADQQQILTQLLAGLMALGILSAILIAANSYWLAGRSILPAQQAWEKQQAFVANASHELRTPLTLIRASAEVALRKTPIEDNRHELLGDILNESDQMARLINDLLMLSRLDTESLTLTHEEISPVELFEEICRQFSRLTEGHGVSLKIGQAQGKAWGDAVRFRQVLLILMDNALRYTPSGGTICLEAHPQGNQMVFTVTDTGTGIAAEHLAHVFDRFYMADHSRSTENQGSGLGLSIAWSLMKAQNGSIAVESQVGQGTQVILRLPRPKSL
jgi:signal transduction histidine kinase